jgi:hypothetical protein
VSAAAALERIAFTDEQGQPQNVEGRVLVEAADGGLLVEGRDLRLWTIEPAQLTGRNSVGGEFTPCTADELAHQLLAEFGKDFDIVRTPHYVICSNAGQDYAEWCGKLFERLWGGFHAQWQADELTLSEPETPLCAIIFSTKRQFTRYAARDAGPGMASAQGYYSIRTNRIVLYDLTGQARAGRVRSTEELNRRLASAELNVATVVHEATHQIAFNCGLHTRYADNPLWLTEGLAMFFETPDLQSRDGWQTAGRVNRNRIERFTEFANRRRKTGSLRTLVSDDDRFRNTHLATDAYAEAWALHHFLLQTHRPQYVEYLSGISEKPRLIWNSAEARLAEFQAAFGNLEQLDVEFLRYVQELR